MGESLICEGWRVENTWISVASVKCCGLQIGEVLSGAHLGISYGAFQPEGST